MQTSWAHQTLIGATRGELEARLLREATPQAWDEMLAAASTQGVQGWLSAALSPQTGTPPHVLRVLGEAASEVESAHAAALESLARAVEALTASGIIATALDGPVLSARCYGNASARAYPGIELLVSPSDIDAARAALSSSDFRLREEARPGPSFEAGSGAPVELYSHIVASPGARAALRMTDEELVCRTVTYGADGVACGVLPAAEEMARLCLRASLGDLRLIRLLDVAGLAARETVDWERTALLLRRWRVGGSGYLVLWLARRWANAPVPLEELNFLRPDPLSRRAFGLAADRVDLARGRSREILRGIAGLAADSLGSKRLAVAGSRPRGDFVRRPWGYRSPARGVVSKMPDIAQQSRPPIVLFSPSRSKGMSHYVDALAQAMKPSCEIIVLDGARDDQLLRTWQRLSRLVRARGATVLVTSPHPSVPLGLLLLGGSTGGFVFHDPILDAPGRLMRPLHVLYYRALAKRLGVVVLHGSLFRHQVLELRLKAREIVVVPHGLAPAELNVDEPYDPSGPLVFLGRLHPYKGLEVLLEALTILKRRGIEPNVVIGGQGVTESAAPPELPNVDVLPGALSDDLFRSLIARCSVVLLPYERANQSGVLATAFRAGRPVIASAVGAFPEYVDDHENGLLVPPGNPGALAGAIERLHGDGELALHLAEGAARTGREVLDPERAGAVIADALTK